MTIVVAGASLMSALAGVLAWAFSRINAPGYNGWRFIFILEGGITILSALGAFLVLDEYPDKSRFLTKKQRETAVALISRDREENHDEKLTFSLILKTLCDWQIWIFGVLYMLSVTITYGLSYFIPLILNGRMGFSGALSQLLSTPPYFYGFLLSIVISTLSDRCQLRSPFIVFLQLNIILGITLTRWGPNTASRYLGLFFCLSGALVTGPMSIVFAQNNAPTRVKRSVSSGLQLSLGAIGGIIGSTVFRSQDAPTYTPGVIVVLCSCVVNMGICSFLYWYLQRLNKLQKDTGLVLEGQVGFRYTP